MKIGIDIRTLMDARYSGVSEFTLNLLENLLAIDRENHYKLYYNAASDVSARLPKFDYPNVELIRTRFPNKLFNYFFQKLFNWPKIDRLLDVDLFLMPHLNFAALAGTARSVLVIHDLSFLRYPDFFSRRKNIWHSLLSVKKLAQRFDHVVTISRNSKADVVSLLGVPEKNVTVINSGLSGDFCQIEPGDERLALVKQKYALPDKFIFTISTLEPRKNIESLIEAFDMFCEQEGEGQQYELIIAGARGWKSGRIDQAWQESKNKQRIRFLDYVDREDKVYLYNLASLFVFPSYYEGFGFPPLEAMASGLPVITSFSSSLPEVVADAAIAVDPYDVKELSRAIGLVLADESLKEELIRRSLLAARQFNWRETAANYLALFTEANEKRASR